MATYYVDSTATGGSNTGGSWANAYLTFAQAVTAATTIGDIIKVAPAHSESISADATYTVNAAHTINNPLQIICTNTGTGAATTGALIGAQATSYSIIITGNFYCYGLELKVPGTAAKLLKLNASAATKHARFEACTFNLATTSGSAYIQTGYSNGSLTEFVGCIFNWGSTTQGMTVQDTIKLIGCDMCNSATAAATLFTNNAGGIGKAIAIDCDMSDTTTLLTAMAVDLTCINCKLPESYTALGTGNFPDASVTLLNCNNGDVHYSFAHHNRYGSTTLSTGVYVTADDASPDGGTTKYSWVVASTANADRDMPYVSPWISVYHSGTGAITPRLEVLRKASTTAYKDDEVWAEWSYQGTSGNPLGIVASDRLTDPNASGSNQGSSALSASDWTGEDATNNWFGKLEPTATITPAEVGHLMVRVCVGKASVTDLYVDPQIRGRS